MMLKNLRRKLIGDLRANRGQFLLVWLVIMLGTTFYGGMYPAAVNLVDSLYRTYDRFELMDFQVQLQATSPETVNTLDAVRAIPGVEAAEARLVVESGVQFNAQQHRVGLRVISVPDDHRASVNRTEVVKGRAIESAGELLLLESFARVHGVEPGDTVQITLAGTPVALRVAGLAFNPEYFVNSRSSESSFPSPSTFGVAWMRHSDLAALSSQPGAFNEIIVRLEGAHQDDRTATKADVQAALREQFPTATILTQDQTPSAWMLDANISGVFPMMRFFSGLFLGGATIITGVLMARVVESERQRIGTMRALGVTRRELVAHYLTFGFIVGVTGGLVGSVLGYFTSFWFMYSFLDNIAGGSVPGFSNTPQLPFILLGFVTVVAGATLAGIYPAWRMSGTPPGIALRPAAPRPPNATSRIKLAFLPLPVRQALRNLLRAPGRATSTALGVMAGAMMVFSALAMWDTLETNFTDFFTATDFDVRADLTGLLPGDGIEARMAAIEGVEAAQAALAGPVSVIQGDGSAFNTIAVAVDERDPFFDLKTLEGTGVFSSADGVWIGHNLARVLALDPGDTLTLRAFEQTHEVRVLGVVSQAIGSPIFVPRSLLVQWTPGGIFPANMVLLRVADRQAGAVRDALADLPDVRAIEVLDEFDRDMNAYLDYYRSNTIMFGSFGLLLTLAIVFNTVHANLRERYTELAILRALGTQGYEIALMVTLEFMIVVVAGIAIGAPLGRAAGYYLVTGYDTDYYGVVPTILALSYVIGIGLLLVTVLLAEIPGLRAVQQTDLGAVCKAQSF